MNRLPLLLLSTLALAGCVNTWVNSRITDPAEARVRLNSDSTYCRQIENMLQKRVDIQDRISFDPTVVGQMSNYYANYKVERIRSNVFEKCMVDRGWTRN